MTDMGVHPYLLADTLVLCVAQRLVRLLCPHCKVPPDDRHGFRAVPMATCLFHLQMNDPSGGVASGMGTCGLVGQIGVYTGWVADVASGAKAGITAFDWAGLLLVSFVLPAVLCAVLGALFRKKGWIKDGDLKLD